ncbi:DUF922 domain-containing Zn-dependent protease [Mucilaginibacter sp. RS28]|uniref:DUF922 domain-containing Zn-dependent protease n=1 Tax=Mucilaginibacter straminoryzae TaxID=2932774 RepID=A0A9X1X0Q3_9SPHI|nr:DUF922 domain-containing protein [Mucilaginibacter straminoryzae]MCJ8208235.1 DUF922 domain-containing Zn-dependent protease [Mucilaginibacter straminoryzae]
MNPRKVRVICAVALCLGIFSAKAQYHLLNTSDFQGRPDCSGNVAYTNCTIDFSYQPTPANGFYHLDFRIKVVVNKDRSWIDKSRITSGQMLDEILKHEQGHYTLAFLMQQEMLRVFANTRFGSNYEQQVNTIFGALKNKYHQLNNDYDEDTNHSIDRKQQNSWDLYFRQQIGQYTRVAMNN